MEPLVLPLSRTLRFRDSNIEGIDLVNPADVDGVLVDKRGRVSALWSSFAIQSGGESAQFNRGIGADLVAEYVDIVRNDRGYYSLEAEFVYTPLFAARNRGVDEEWIAKLEQNNPVFRRALSITRLVAGSPAAQLLRNGDYVLAIDGNVVTSYRAVEKAVQKEAVTVTIWRDGAAMDIEVQTAALDSRGIDRAVSWAGALLQDPHRAMAAQRGIEPDGVYIGILQLRLPGHPLRTLGRATPG